MIYKPNHPLEEGAFNGQTNHNFLPRKFGSPLLSKSFAAFVRVYIPECGHSLKENGSSFSVVSSDPPHYYILPVFAGFQGCVSIYRKVSSAFPCGYIGTHPLWIRWMHEVGI